jgi:hypothetical protein
MTISPRTEDQGFVDARNAQGRAINMPYAVRVKTWPVHPILIKKSIKALCTHENTVYLSLPGVYPMLTRVGP